MNPLGKQTENREPATRNWFFFSAFCVPPWRKQVTSVAAIGCRIFPRSSPRVGPGSWAKTITALLSSYISTI